MADRDTLYCVACGSQCGLSMATMDSKEEPLEHDKDSVHCVAERSIWATALGL